MTELGGKRVFILEDELLIRMGLETIVEDLGCVIAATAATVKDGLSVARDADVDAALLDVNIADELSDAVAQVLIERKIPFAFLTAYGSQGVAVSFPGAYVIQKPYTTMRSARPCLKFWLEAIRACASRRAAPGPGPTLPS